MTTTIPLESVIETGKAIVEGKVRGRVVVEVGSARFPSDQPEPLPPKQFND